MVSSLLTYGLLGALLPRGAVTTPLFAFASSASPRAQQQQRHCMPASEGQPVEPLLLVLVDLPRALTEARRARFACLPLYGAVALNASKDVVASLCGTFLPRPGSLDLNEGCPSSYFFSDVSPHPHRETKGSE